MVYFMCQFKILLLNFLKMLKIPGFLVFFCSKFQVFQSFLSLNCRIPGFLDLNCKTLGFSRIPGFLETLFLAN